jgi:uncharacterized protein HemX
MNANSRPAADEEMGSSNAGWIAGLVVIAAVLAVGGAAWFMYHP